VQYEKVFDPPEVARYEEADDRHPGGDLRDGSVYVYDERTVLAVNVALVTRRPLLVSGPPGSGKSSLAPAIARFMREKGWRYEGTAVSTRTEARDLLWTFDAVQRLSDAQVNELKADRAYIRPQVLWRAIDPVKAAEYGPEGGEEREVEGGRAVVLLDEIDKADPDVPNDLLVPLGSYTFDVTPTGDTVKLPEDAAAPLVVLTTNDERELSRPFVRRCVVLELEAPDPDRLVGIAKSHHPDGDEDLFQAVADQIAALQPDARSTGDPVPNAAEYLDAVKACMELGVTPGSEVWEHVAAATLRKRVRPDAR
jgi:MoxR-like ATPase